MSYIHQGTYRRVLWLASAISALMGTSVLAQETPEPPLPMPAPVEPEPAPVAAVAAEPAPAVVPAEAAAPPAAADVDISAYLAENVSSEALTTDDTALHIYGFADFGVNYLSGNALRAFFGETPAFVLGNLNLYAAANLSERWKTLIEVRFAFAPDGVLDANFKRVSTLANDYANVGANLRWGSISIERAWLEYSFHELLTIRGGSWLTPVGIWNVDHGTPTIIPTMRPYVVSSVLFPTRQTGIEIYGSRLFGETTLGYHLTLSNGRGSIASYGDLDKNKAVGWRLFSTFALLDGTLTLGFSGYTGRSTDSDIAVGAAGLAYDVTSQFDELSLAGDLLFKWQGVHLQAEFFSQQSKFTSAGQIVPPLPGPHGGVLADYHRIGGYALLGYRLPWFPLTPFIEFDVIDNGGWELTQPGGPHQTFAYTGGLNYRPIATLALKGQYTRLVFQDIGGTTTPFNAVQVMAAWSF